MNSIIPKLNPEVSLRLEKVLRWTAPLLKPTISGYRHFRRTEATEQFWSLWKPKRPELRAAGITVRKKNQTWVVDWLKPVLTETDDETQKSATRQAASVALDAIKASGAITLTAASHVISAEADWVPAKLAQKEDRSHRIGQQDFLLCSYLVVEGSVDALMLQFAIDKLEIAEGILNGSADRNSSQSGAQNIRAAQPQEEACP